MAVKRSSNHIVLILGSDGLWEKTPESLFVSTCQKSLQLKNAAEKICKELVSVAMKRWDTVNAIYTRNVSSIEMM
jgi:serine/threonine protein phosphatase PrpC